MIDRLFGRTPDRRATIFDEALALIDEGVPRTEVLAMFEDDADWLAAELGAAQVLAAPYRDIEPDPAFAAALRQRLVRRSARRELAPEIVPARVPGPARFAGLTAGLTATAAAVGALFFGIATSGNSVPGDWNYTFKLAGERVELATSRGDGRVDVKLRIAERRVQEITSKVGSGGRVSAEEVENATREWIELAVEVRDEPLDEDTRERLNEAGTAAVSALTEIQDNSEDPPAVAEAVNAVNDAVAAGNGGTVVPLPSPEPTPTPTPSPTPTQEPSPTATPTQTPTETPTNTATPTPTETPTPTATPTPEETGSPTASETAESTGTPDPGQAGGGEATTTAEESQSPESDS